MDVNVITEQNSPEQDLIEQEPSAPVQPSQDMGDYLDDYQAPKRGDICKGVVIGKDDRGLIVDVGLKREGLVPASDLERLDDETRSTAQVGSEVTVFVLQPADRNGYPILSIHQAQLSKDWIQAEEMMASGEMYESQVSGYNRGGLIVKFGKIRGFVPASQIVDLPKRLSPDDRRQRLADMVGQDIGLRIIEVDRQRRRLIFSQRRALRAWQDAQRNRVMDQLTKGEVEHGKVTSITNFGAFVDLGGADGLIHVSELGWGRVDDPHQVLKVGDEVDVYVLDIDRQRKRIALSLKRLQPDPWTLIDEHYKEGQLVEGRVTRVLDFGAFVELELGVEGLLHSSEMIGTPELGPADIVHPGEELLLKIIRIDSAKRRLALSAKQVRQSEWERWVAEKQAPEEKTAVAEEEPAPPQVEATGTEPGAEEMTPEAAPDDVTEEQVAEPEVEAASGEPGAEEMTPEVVPDDVTEEQVAEPEVKAASGEPGAEEMTPEAAPDDVTEDQVAEPEAEAASGEPVAEEMTPEVVPDDVTEEQIAESDQEVVALEPALDQAAVEVAEEPEAA